MTEPDTTADTTALNGTTPVEPVEKSLPQSVVNALIAREKRSVEERASRDRRVLEERIAELESAAIPKEAPKQKEEPKSDNGMRGELDELKAAFARSESDLAFERHLAGKALTETQRTMLRKLWVPGDTVEFDKYVAEMTVSAAPPAKPAAPTEPPVVPIGAPGSAPDGALEVDARRWSKDHIDRMRADGTFLKRLEAFRQTLPGGAGDIPFARKKIPT